MFDGFDNNDGIIDDEADREDETKKRQRVDRKAEERKQSESADQRYRNRAQRNESRAPALQKNENNENDQRERFKNVFKISSIPSVTESVWSSDTTYSMSAGNCCFASAMNLRTA